jgi:hypothetical protein
VRLSNQSSAHRIFADICHFFIKALVTQQSMVEEISPPGDVRDSSRDPFKSRIKLEGCAFPGTPISMFR